MNGALFGTKREARQWKRKQRMKGWIKKDKKNNRFVIVRKSDKAVFSHEYHTNDYEVKKKGGKAKKGAARAGVRVTGNGGGPELRPARKSSYSQDYSNPVMDQKSAWLRRLFRQHKRNRGGDGPQYPPEEPEPYPVIIDGREKIVYENGLAKPNSNYLSMDVDSSDGLLNRGDTIIIRDNSYYYQWVPIQYLPAEQQNKIRRDLKNKN